MRHKFEDRVESRLVEIGFSSRRGAPVTEGVTSRLDSRERADWSPFSSRTWGKGRSALACGSRTGRERSTGSHPLRHGSLSRSRRQSSTGVQLVTTGGRRPVPRESEGFQSVTYFSQSEVLLWGLKSRQMSELEVSNLHLPYFRLKKIKR